MGFKILEGFDLYNGVGANFGLFSRWLNLSGGGSRSFIAGRFGGQALRMTDATGDTSIIRRAYAGAHSAFSIGFALRENDIVNLGNQPFFRMELAGATQMSLYLDGGTGTVRVYRGLGTTVLVTSAVGAFTDDTYNYYELRGLLDQAVGWVELYINGVLIGRYDGDTCALAGTTMDGVLLQTGDHVGSGNSCDFDDLYVADESTRFGECRIETLRPMADTAQKQFTPQTGPSNYTNVDDPTFATADYVESSTAGHVDLYELADLSNTPETIHAVKPVISAWKTDAGGRLAATVIDSGGSQSTSGDIALSNDSSVYDGQTLTTDPQGGAAWTPARVNALKLGPKVSA